MKLHLIAPRTSIRPLTALIMLSALGGGAHAIVLGNPLLPRDTQDGSDFVLVTSQFSPTPEAGMLASISVYNRVPGETIDLVLLTPQSGTLYNVQKRQTVTLVSEGINTFVVNWSTPADSIFGYYGRGPAYGGGGDAGTGNRIYYVNGSDFFTPGTTTFDTQNSFSSDRRYSLQAEFTPVPEPATLVALGLPTLALLRRRRKTNG